MLITKVSVRVAPFSGSTWLDQQRVSTPMSRFPEHSASRASWRGPGSDLVWVYIETDDAHVFGIGQSRGGKVTAALIEHHFAGLLVGRDALEISRRTEEIRLACMPYAAGGISAMGVSAIELALWDLSARAAGLPLVTLLGGRLGPLPYYLTVPHPDLLRELDPEMIASAVTVKVPAAWGPADGPARLAANVTAIEQVRDAVPDHVGVSIDCFMSWTVPYALEFARLAAPFGLDWIEEPLMPDDFEGYAGLRSRLGPVRVAGGEHLFSLLDGKRFIDGRCADVFQIDVTWGGGITVASTLGALAIDSGMTFAPHAAALQPWSVHLLGAQRAGAVAELLVGVDGTASVPEPSPGPGVGIDPAAVGFVSAATT